MYAGCFRRIRFKNDCWVSVSPPPPFEVLHAVGKEEIRQVRLSPHLEMQGTGKALPAKMYAQNE